MAEIDALHMEKITVCLYCEGLKLGIVADSIEKLVCALRDCMDTLE